LNLVPALDDADTFAPAPFLTAQAQAPQEASAVWLRADDRVRLRGGILGHGPKGTVLLLQGRTEYLEKYGRAAAELASRGFGTVSVDFRGQGLSDRVCGGDPRIGHVRDFSDYQHDVAALLHLARQHKLPKPWFLLGHSMGGAIGLRALLEGMEVRGAVFSAPMWGIAMMRPLLPVAYGLGYASHWLQFDTRLTPSTTCESYVREAEPGDNVLTRDPEMLQYMRGHLAADARLEVGGPSIGWLYRALRECRVLTRTPLPPVPSLTFLPAEDEVICPTAIRRMVQRWRGASLVEVPGARHEIMMETAALRMAFYDRTTLFMDARA
jgi:lysophospholipase